MNLVLASASPRRSELLRRAGIPFRVIKPRIEEKPDYTLPPREMVVRLAAEKALSVSGTLEEGFVLGADTVVVYRGEVLGKPDSPEDARRMLRLLNGDVHEVLTGLVIINPENGAREDACSETKVWFKKLSDKEINAYIDSGEPLDKAGAYGIQGRASLFVERIEGCYFNVVGLPLSLLYDLMKKMRLEA